MVKAQAIMFIEQVKAALIEDIGSGDITANLLPLNLNIRATILSRDHCVLCGTEFVNSVFDQLDSNVVINWFFQDGDVIQSNTVLAEIIGSARAVLTAERVALNFLQSLSAVATSTKEYVDAVSQWPTKIFDTRKTLPGWRYAQKYAVRVGGGFNQRMGLYDAYLIKENHINALGSIAACYNQAKKLMVADVIQVEVETITQLLETLPLGCEFILLDNFSIDELDEAVNLTQGKAILEASGNINLKNVKLVTATGVDRISIGAITKNIVAVDLSLQFND